MLNKMALHKSIGYPSTRPSYIPCHIELSHWNPELDCMNETDLSDLYKIFRSAAECSLNVGIDEYPNTEYMEQMFRDCEVFTLKKRGSIAGCIVIQPWKMTPTFDPRIAQLICVLASSVYTKEDYQTTVLWAEKLAIDLKLKYSAGCISVLACNDDLLPGLRDLGFQVLVEWPSAAKVPGNRDLINTWILWKRFSAYAEVMRPIGDILAYRERLYNATMGNIDQPVIHKMDFLPVTVIAYDGTLLEVDNISPESYTEFYRLFIDASLTGHGFGIDLFVSYRLFLIQQLHRHRAFCVRNASTKKTIGFYAFGPAESFCRTQDVRASCAFMVIDPHMKGRKLGSCIMDLSYAIRKEVGYAEHKTSAVATNGPILAVMRKAPNNVMARIPLAAWIKGHGLVDRIIIHVPLNGPSLSQLPRDTEGHVILTRAKL